MIRIFAKTFFIFLLAILSPFFNPSILTGQEFLSNKPLSIDFEETTSLVVPGEMSPKKTLSLGVILPLSGDYTSFGESVLKGILLAGGIFGPESDDGFSIDIIVKDSKQDPLVTARIMDELDREGVIGIIGPLLSRTSVTGALEAQNFKIPMISLSQREGLPEIGDYVFRNSLTPSKQIEVLVRHAIAGLGLERFGILYPETPYGRRLMYSFVDEVKELGGEIVRTEAYSEDQTDFGEEIRKLFQISETEDPRKKGRVIFEPLIDFDALFIPDYFDRVGLIAPQITFYNIKEIQLLGSNGWNSPNLLEIGGRFVEDATFVDGFFLNSSDSVVENFREAFETTFHITPGILEAQAFDMTNMVIHLLKEEYSIDRESLKESLYSIEDFAGVTGEITFDEQGEALKDLFLLKVEEGKIIQVEEVDQTEEDEAEEAEEEE